MLSQTGRDDAPDMGPGDAYEDCAHAAACRWQWEREHGEWDDEQFGAIDLLARELGCGNGCPCHEDDYRVPLGMSGIMRDGSA